MDNFAGNEVKEIRSTKNAWYDWLINYIPEPVRKCISPFKTNTPNLTVCELGEKLSKQSYGNKINSIRNKKSTKKFGRFLKKKKRKKKIIVN